MPLKWELLGKQELPDDRVHVYEILLWRTPVPGGWLLMTVNKRSNSPDPVLSFYPDPDHIWRGHTDPQADYLLRPAAGSYPVSAQQLLRAASADSANETPPEE